MRVRNQMCQLPADAILGRPPLLLLLLLLLLRLRGDSLLLVSRPPVVPTMRSYDASPLLSVFRVTSAAALPGLLAFRSYLYFIAVA